MVTISPRKLAGKWIVGYALDIHTTSSTYLGDDEYGRPQFDTQRSEIGELLYRLKYGNDKSVITVITETAADFVRKQKWPIDLLIPVPPSRVGRALQPVNALSKALAAQLEVGFCADCVVKVKNTPELKQVYDLKKDLPFSKERMLLLRQK
jgi:competence protein ComFC